MSGDLGCPLECVQLGRLIRHRRYEDWQRGVGDGERAVNRRLLGHAPRLYQKRLPMRFGSYKVRESSTRYTVTSRLKLTYRIIRYLRAWYIKSKFICMCMCVYIYSCCWVTVTSVILKGKLGHRWNPHWSISTSQWNLPLSPSRLFFFFYLLMFLSPGNSFAER